ncbi:MAG TPA: hypothetical protein VEY91_03180 [Candidatus Limnocylindria bacterium]|nr:hypothetical protein [Candidatus Limnocylindria bacterium]
MPPAPAWPPWRLAGYALLALFFAFAHLRLIVLLMPKAFQLSAAVGEGVVRGEPPWRVYQSRVLGPQLVHAMAESPDRIAEAYAAFAILVLFVSGFCLLWLTNRLRDPRRPAVPAFLILQAGFAVLLPCIWLYAWDLLALLFFTLFNYLVLARTRRAWFAILVPVALLNHEIALFMAVWLVLDPVVRYVAGPRSASFRFDWASSVLGLALIGGGVALIETLRRTLLVRETLRPEELLPQITYGGSVHFSLRQNWNTLASSFTLEPAAAYPFVVTLFLILVLVLAVRLARSDLVRYGALAAIVIGMVGALLLFGLVFETRVLMPLLPFVAMNAWHAFARESSGGAAEGAIRPHT